MIILYFLFYLRFLINTLLTAHFNSQANITSIEAVLGECHAPGGNAMKEQQ
jgi:hypothetical protein